MAPRSRSSCIGWGGKTSTDFDQAQPPSRWRSALITAAGPVAGFLFGGTMIVLVDLASPDPEALLSWVVAALGYVSIVWGLLNLVPMLPLDGGYLLRLLLSGRDQEIGLRRTLYLSVVLGTLIVAATVYPLLTGGAREWRWRAAFFGLGDLRGCLLAHNSA